VNDVDWALQNIPGVEDGAGFILKDMRDNPVVACAVVKIQNHPVSDKSVLEACATKLSGHKIPKVVVFAENIPRDKGGNVNRIRLKGQFSGAAL
jgi:long-chain acyl-CoA synthetase